MDLYKSCQCIRIVFLLHIPFVKGMTHHLNNLELSAMCQDWLQLALWIYIKVFNVLVLFSYYNILEKGKTLHLNNLELSVMCQVCLKIDLEQRNKY